MMTAMYDESGVIPRQLELGELIALLQAEDPARVVPLGFGNPHSYRGHYEQLAFEPVENTTIGAMLAAAESAVGTTYEGWKGGQYTMDERTDVWLAWEGQGGAEPLGAVLVSFMLGHRHG